MAKWWTLIAVCVATFMLLLDITVVNVALPYIERDLNSSFEDLQWVIDAYSLMLAAFLLTAGTVGDRIGRRAVFIWGLVIFTVASALCGLSGSPLMLNLARALQGIGGSLMFATSLALLASAYQGPDRGTAIGIWGATIGGAVAVGPLVGGVLTEWIGWEAIFYVNVPIGIYAIALTLRRVGESHDPQAGGADWIGTVTFSAALFLLVFGLIRGNAEDWNATIVACLVGAAVLLVAFVVAEMRVSSPMFDLALFRKPSFSGASVAAFVLSASMFGMILYLVLYLQNILQYDALPAGLRFTPVTLTAALLSPIAGRRSGPAHARYFMGAGLGLIGLGLLLMTLVSTGDAWTVMLPGFIVAGMASGINSTFRQVGTAVGIAVWGAIFEHTVAAEFPGPGGADLVISGAATNNPRLAPLAEQAFVAGLDRILLISGIVALVGSVVVAVLVRPQDFVGQATAGERPTETPVVAA